MAEATFQPGAPAGFVAESGMRGFERGQSMMARAQQMRQSEELAQIRRRQAEQQFAEDVLLMPVKQAEARANLVKARTDLDVAQRTQENRASAYDLYDKAAQDFEFLNLIPNDKARARASREWLGRYSQLENIRELQPQVKQMNEIAAKNIQVAMGLAGLGAEGRLFNILTNDLSEEDKEKARRVKLGLEGRQSGSRYQPVKVTLPDGSEATLSFDKSSGDTGVPGVTGRRGEEVIDIKTSSPLVGQGTKEKEQAQQAGKLAADKAAARPKREGALRKAETDMENMVSDLEALIPRANAITTGLGGKVAGIVPGTPAYDFARDLDSVKARLGFQVLDAMRQASPTGGALGSITEKELDFLQNAIASLEIGQSEKQTQENIRKVIRRIQQTFGVVRSAFESDYEDAPAVPAGISELSTESLEARRQELLKQRKP